MFSLPEPKEVHPIGGSIGEGGLLLCFAMFALSLGRPKGGIEVGSIQKIGEVVKAEEVGSCS